MKIAVFCPNLIGDTVMATPTFRACAGFPGATIVGVIKPRVAPTLDATPWFDDWIYFDRRSSQRRRADRRGRSPIAPRAVSVGGSFAEHVSQRLDGLARPDSTSGSATTAIRAACCSPTRLTGSPRLVEAADTDADRGDLSQAGSHGWAARSTRYDSSWPRRPTTKQRRKTRLRVWDCAANEESFA